jgi:DNA-binding LacI/PurR family transcriptional regulator
MVADRAAVLGAVDRLLRQDVEALVLIAPDRLSLEAIQGVELGVPLVTAESSGQTELHSVSIDQYAGARIATAHLAELGHRCIAHLAGPSESLDALERERGWRAELAHRNLAPGPLYVGDWLAESGYRRGLEIAPLRQVTAVFSSNDQMALGLLHAFADMGRRVPADVSVVGFDDIPEAAHYQPPLTTVRQDFSELGRRIMASVLDALQRRPSERPASMEPHLVERNSTAALGRGTGSQIEA